MKPIHIVFYKDISPDRLIKLVELHCADHHPSTKEMCMSLVNLCVDNNCPHTSCIGDGGDIVVDMLT